MFSSNTPWIDAQWSQGGRCLLPLPTGLAPLHGWGVLASLIWSSLSMEQSLANDLLVWPSSHQIQPSLMDYPLGNLTSEAYTGQNSETVKHGAGWNGGSENRQIDSQEFDSRGNQQTFWSQSCEQKQEHGWIQMLRWTGCKEPNEHTERQGKVGAEKVAWWSEISTLTEEAVQIMKRNKLDFKELGFDSGCPVVGPGAQMWAPKALKSLLLHLKSWA